MAEKTEQRPTLDSCVRMLSYMVDKWKPAVICSERVEISKMGMLQLTVICTEKDESSRISML
jgi:hypothetical protein